MTRGVTSVGRRAGLAVALLAVAVALVAIVASGQSGAGPGVGQPVAATGVAAPGRAPAAVARDKDPLAGRFGGPFTLVGMDGRAASDANFRGKFMLVYFGYTHCPDVCPLDLSTIGQAMDLLGPQAERVQPVFITVDPARDTPELLAAYVTSIHPKLLGLTGSEEQIAAVARAYKVHRRKIPTPSAALPDDYVIDHGSLTYLMGPDGSFRTLIPHNTPAERMATVIKDYLAKADAGVASRG